MQLVKVFRSSTACAVGIASLALALNAAPALAAESSPVTAPVGVQLLTNPGHEHPGVYFGGRGEINVTWNWVPFWQEPPAGDNLRDQNYRTPEFRPVFASIYPDRVHTGGGSDRWFNFYALNKAAGIMQLVPNLPIGQPVRFTTWAQLWSSNNTGNPPTSTADGNMKIRVCIQADGGPRNMLEPNLKCSDWAQPYDKYVQLSVDAVALTSTVIALIQSTADIPVQHNDAYADDSCFEILPTADATGICNGAGYIPTAAGVGVAGSTPAATAAAPATNSGAITAPAGSDPKAAVLAAGINVRGAPSLSGAIIGGYKRGSIVTVTGKSADGKWYQISYKTANGWVYAGLVVPNEAATAVAVAQ